MTAPTTIDHTGWLPRRDAAHAHRDHRGELSATRAFVSAGSARVGETEHGAAVGIEEDVGFATDAWRQIGPSREGDLGAGVGPLDDWFAIVADGFAVVVECRSGDGYQFVVGQSG